MPRSFPRGCFEFAWIHPPYWRQKLYADDPRDLSRTPTLEAFLDRYRLLIATVPERWSPAASWPSSWAITATARPVSCRSPTTPSGWPSSAGLRQRCTDIIRFSHGASSSKKVYRSSFIPGLHDVCCVFRKPV